MKQYKFITATFFLALTIAGVSCSQIEDERWGVEATQLVINASDAGRVNSDSSYSRAVDKDYATTFTQGDQMGLFAVKDGVLVEDLKNVPLTFNGTGWTPKTPLLYDEEETTSITYYAYYPYKPNLASEPVLDGGDFFTKIAAEWETGKVQSAHTSYSAFDLMTSGVTRVTSVNGRYSLQFKLEHRMGLFVFQLPTTEYEFVDGDGNPVGSATYKPELYILPPTGVKFYQESATEGNEIQPLVENELYHLIVNPAKEQDIVVHFNDRKFAIKTTAVGSGKYKKNVVDGGQRTVKHHLQVGDFYCADGNIVSVGQTPPKNCIGIVYYVGETRPSKLYPDKYKEEQDVLLREYPSCNHGLVLALDETEKRKFADDKTNNFDNIFKLVPFADSYIKLTDATTKPTTTLAMPHCIGFNNTRLMYELIEYQCTNIPGTNVANMTNLPAVLNNYSGQVAVPTLHTTGWFLPSIYEWNKIFENRVSLNESLSGAKGTGLSNVDFYWSSTERNATNQWYYSVNGYDYNTKNATSAMSHFRFTLAF